MGHVLSFPGRPQWDRQEYIETVAKRAFMVIATKWSLRAEARSAEAISKYQIANPIASLRSQ